MLPNAKGQMVGTGVRMFVCGLLPIILPCHTTDEAIATSLRWKAGSATFSLAASLILYCVC